MRPAATIIHPPWDDTMTRQAEEMTMPEPFVDDEKVIEACEKLARSFYAYAREDDAAGRHENAARLRREADAHLHMAEQYRSKLSQQDEAA